MVLSVLGLTTPAAFDAGGGSKHGQKHGSKIAAKSCLLMSLPFLFFWGGEGKTPEFNICPVPFSIEFG